MDRMQKAEAIAALSEKFGNAKAAFLVDFKGMSVEQVTSLRKTLTPIRAEMKVVRNTLARRALKNHPQSEAVIADKFVGTNAVVFAYEDVSAAAKALSEFAKDVEQLDVKAGVMDGGALNGEQIKYLATLPGKDVLRAQLLGVLSAPMSKFVRTLGAVPSGFVRVLAAKSDQAG